jgi:DNA-binding transcriptional ArsR family regulator
MALAHPLPDPVVELIARRFRVIGEPVRIRLLYRLHEGEATVTELVEIAGGTQQNVSKHLSVLLHAGILGRRKQGTSVYYRIVDPTVLELCEQVCDSLQRHHSELGLVLGGVSP